MVVYPPSPALSTCSEDLEAILNAAGPISRFPTPPWPTKTAQSRDESIVDRKQTSSQRDTCDRVAKLFTHTTSLEAVANSKDIDHIRRILLRANLPAELLACAYNILLELSHRHVLRDLVDSWSDDLVIIGTLSLTMSYIVDHPPSYQHWAAEICPGLWTAADIDSIVWRILEALDFRLSHCFSPEMVEMAMEAMFLEPVAGDSIDTSSCPLDDGVDEKAAMDDGVRLGFVAEGSVAYWSHGQVTPDASPPYALPA